MSGGTFVASTSVQLSGVFPPFNSVIDGVLPLQNITISQTDPSQLTLAYGSSGSGNENLIVCVDKTLTQAGGATPTATYDLYTGTDLPDLGGLTAAFRFIRWYSVHVISGGDTAGVQVGGAASNAWPAFFSASTAKALCFPGGPPVLGGSPAGVAVGASTKNLLIENLGAVSVNVRIIVSGTTS
jgi:hypothetical protein